MHPHRARRLDSGDTVVSVMIQLVVLQVCQWCYRGASDDQVVLVVIQ
jgi:hypothetical protein